MGGEWVLDLPLSVPDKRKWLRRGCIGIGADLIIRSDGTVGIGTGRIIDYP